MPRWPYLVRLRDALAVLTAVLRGRSWEEKARVSAEAFAEALRVAVHQ